MSIRGDIFAKKTQTIDNGFDNHHCFNCGAE